jgi:hypothetical protein
LKLEIDFFTHTHWTSIQILNILAVLIILDAK